MSAPDLKVVELHEGRPLLNDIPGRLRHLAEQLEAGEHGEVDFAFVILDGEQPMPICIGFGDLPKDRAVLGLLDQAHEVFMQMVRDAQEAVNAS